MHTYKVEVIVKGKVKTSKTFIPARLGATSDSIAQIDALVWMRVQALGKNVDEVNLLMDGKHIQTLNGPDYRKQIAEEKLLNDLLADPTYGPRILRGEMTVEQALAQRSA